MHGACLSPLSNCLLPGVKIGFVGGGDGEGNPGGMESNPFWAYMLSLVEEL